MKRLINKNNILAFIIPIFIILSYIIYKTMIYKGDFFSNGEVFLVGDASSQYNALYAYIHNVLVGKDSIFYSFYNSLGGNMSSTIGYYLASPFNILYMFVSKVDIPFVTFIIYIIKISLCSLFMNILLNYKYGNKYTDLIFSISYAFMGFNVVYYFNNMWIDVIYMTPLVILGIERLFKNKPILYIISLTLSIIFNFYMAYMLCIFILLYFIYRLFSEYKLKEFNNYKSILKKFIICSLMGLGLSMFFLLPVLLNLKEIIRAPLTSFNIKITSFKDFIDLIFSKMYIGSNNATSMFGRNRPVIYINLFCLILSIFYFFNKKINLKERLLSLGIVVFFLLSFIIPHFQLFWQLSFPNGYIDRFSYLYSFFLILLSAKQFYSSYKNKILIIIVYIIIIILTYLVNRGDYSFLSNKDIIISIIFITIYLVLYSIFKKINMFILVLVILELLINYFNTMVTVKDMKLESAYGEYYNKICKITNIDNNYRLDGNFNYTLLDSFVCDYRNMTSGLSTINGDLYKFIKSNGGSITYTTIYYDYNKPMIIESLLGIKNTLTTKKIEDDSYKLIKTYVINLSKENRNLFYEIYLYKNTDALSIGFKVDKIYNNKINKDNFKNLNTLIKKLSGIKEDVLIKVKLNKIGNNKYNFFIENSNKKYYLTTDYKISTNYSYYGNLFLDGEAYVNLNSTNIGSIKLDLINSGENILEIKNRKNVNNIYLYYLDEKVYKKVFSKLKERELKNVEFKGNKLKGIIKLDNDSIVMLTIPYDKGWKIYVDGKKIKYYKIANEFVGIEIKKGKHKLYMKYYPKGIFIGTIISISTLIVSIIIVRTKNKHHNN